MRRITNAHNDNNNNNDNYNNNDTFLYQPVPLSPSWNDDSFPLQQQQAYFSAAPKQQGTKHAVNNNHNNITPLRAFQQNVLMIFLGMFMGFLLGYDRSIISTAKYHQQHQHQTTKMMMLNVSSFRNTDMMSALELLGELTRAKRTVLQTMVQEYGLYANMLAMDQDVLNHLFVISDESKRRFQHRILKKIIMQKLYALNAVWGNHHPIKISNRFTWVTAGDTVAGGFGNRPEETYTAVLEETVFPVFAAVGIDFHALNQANKVGYGSAPELALCMNSLYHSNDDNARNDDDDNGIGNNNNDDDDHDIDVLSWDFSRTDGEHHGYRANLWAAKATLHPSKPLLMMMAPKDAPSWWKDFVPYERRGMGVAFMNLNVLSATQSLLPDSIAAASEGTTINLQELPPLLRYLICNGAIEGSVSCNDATQNFACPVEGGDECRAHKFSKPKDDCHLYGRYQTNWAAGWKDHHLRGRLIGIFWINLLQDALLHLDALLETAKKDFFSDEERYQRVLQTMEEQERLDKFLLKNYPSPQFGPGYDEMLKDFHLFGAATTTVNRTECFLMSSSPVAVAKGRSTSLLSTVETIQNDAPCELVKWGHRESFQVIGGGSDMTQWRMLEIPSTNHQFEPLVQIAVCFQVCLVNDESGECTAISPREGDVAEEEKKVEINQHVQIKVNGVDVTGMREMDSCYFLEGANNGFYWELLSPTSYQLEFQVNTGYALHVFSVMTVQ